MCYFEFFPSVLYFLSLSLSLSSTQQQQKQNIPQKLEIAHWVYFHGVCVFHKMRTIYYDLETCIVGKGQKRKQTIPIEIAMLDPQTNTHVECRFWPLEFPIRNALVKHGACVRGSLRCVRKVFGTVPESAKTLQDARRIVKRFLGAADNTLIAHNGTSFDHPIFKEWFGCQVEFGDSLKMLRRDSPHLLSHSLPILTRSVKDKVMEYMRTYAPKSAKAQHRALFDCVALKEVMEHYSSAPEDTQRTPEDTLKSCDTQFSSCRAEEDSRRSWIHVAGVGKKTTACVRVKWSTPQEFIEWKKEKPECEVRACLRALGVRRIPTLLRLK